MSNEKQLYLLRGDELREAAAWYARNAPEAVRKTLETANEACRGRFKVAYSMMANEWVDLGQPVAWLYNPTADPEFTWILNRHWHMRELGKAYLLTGDKAYAEVCKEQIRDWIDRHPVPQGERCEDAVYFQKLGPWRLLETGVRPQSWIFAHACMQREWKSDTAFTELLHRSLAEHAEYLSQYLGDPDINHATMHMQGLYAIGVFLAQHPRSPYWRQLAKARLELCLTRQTGADGVQTELATHYHNVSIEKFAQPYLLAERIGDPFPPSYRERLAAMGRFTACTIRPDGFTSAISDSDCTESGSRKLALLGDVLGIEEYRKLGKRDAEQVWVTGAGSMQEEPAAAPSVVNAGADDGELCAFPDAGYYVLRSPLHYLLFDAAPLGGAHGHADALQLEWFVAGRAVFLDNGRYTYEEGADRRSFKSTAAHNTITIDGMDQTEYEASQRWSSREAAATLHRAIHDGGMTLLDASHDGYTRLNDPVVHRRWVLVDHRRTLLVVVDWLLGEGTHRFAQHFHLHRDTKPHISADGRMAALDVEGSGHPLSMSWHFSASCSGAAVAPSSGWRSAVYGSKEPIPVMRASGIATGNAGIAVVCSTAWPNGSDWRCEEAVLDAEMLRACLTLEHPAHGREQLIVTESSYERR